MRKLYFVPYRNKAEIERRNNSENLRVVYIWRYTLRYWFILEQDRQYTYNVISRRVRATFVAMEKQ